MKKLFAFLIACTLLTGSFACCASAENLVGGWQTPESPDITPELWEIFHQAMDTVPGRPYTPVALVGTQLVAGMNYCFLAEAAADQHLVDEHYANIYIYRDLQGNVTITDIEELETHASSEIAAFAEDEISLIEIPASDFSGKQEGSHLL